MRSTQESVDHLSRLSILGELSTTLAHELSQPLASIANYGRSLLRRLDNGKLDDDAVRLAATEITQQRSEEHTSELQSLMRISYAVFCLKKNKEYNHKQHSHIE